MEVAKVIDQLREELANLDAAIRSLERLQGRSSTPRARTERPKAQRKPLPGGLRKSRQRDNSE
jgi:hypothetical protein